jgi:hypothetical protein
MALQYLRFLEAADTNTFLMLAIGAEIKSYEGGLRSKPETLARIRLILALSRSLQDRDEGDGPRPASSPSPSPD